MGEGAADRIRAFAADAVSPQRRPAGAAGMVAVGWATVDLERAVAQLAQELGVARAIFVAGPPSAVLGAECLIARGILDGDLALAVIEPVAEGPIAAALARWDEGPVVAWYATPAASAVSASGRSGPFGPERLVKGDRFTGPHRLLVDTGTGTIPA